MYNVKCIMNNVYFMYVKHLAYYDVNSDTEFL